MTVLKVLAGVAALLFVAIALFAVIGGALGFINRARRGPTRSPEGLRRPTSDDRGDGAD